MMLHVCILLAASAVVDLQPAPRELVEEGKGAFTLGPMTPLVLSENATPEEISRFEAFSKTLGYDLLIVPPSGFKSREGALFIGEPGRNAALDKRPLRMFGEQAAALPPGGYVLSITRKTVVLAGKDPEGTFRGLQTLTQIAQLNPQEWPCLTIRDWPGLALRGVWVSQPLTAPERAALAMAKCNAVFYDSPDFYDLSGDRESVWRKAFAEARGDYLEPIPVFRIFNKAEALVSLMPSAAEGLTQTDRVSLAGDDFSSLNKRNVIAGEEHLIQVAVSGSFCREHTDYVLEPAPLNAPFSEDAAPTLLRRIPGGQIPDGATVSVTYSYLPAHSEALCPSAPETQALLGEKFERLQAVLSPKYVHIGLETVARLNQDQRCLGQKVDCGTLLGRGLKQVSELMAKSIPGARMIMWSDTIHPCQKAPVLGVNAGEETLPDNVILTLHLTAEDIARPDRLASLLEGCARTSRPVFLGIGDESLGAAVSGVMGQYACVTGMFMMGFVEKSEWVRSGLRSAWSPLPAAYPWPGGFNAFFHTSFGQPSRPEQYRAVIAALNQQTLAGVGPEQNRQSFDAMVKAMKPAVAADDPDRVYVERLYSNLTEYLMLESTFVEKPEKGLLRHLLEVVKKQAELDPALGPDRLARIVSTIENQGLFVPASILFSEPLLYYRNVRIPADCRLLEIPLKADYQDEAQYSRAYWDLPASYSVRRIDYETVGARRVLLEYSEDGSTFEKGREWTASGAGEVYGPALVDQIPSAKRLRLTVEGNGGRSVLREARLFGLKGPARASCPFQADAGRAHAAGKGLEWIGAPQLTEFVDVASRRFAEAPTEVRLCRNRTHLFVGVSAKEPRLPAMIADIKTRDGALETQESVVILLNTGKAPLYRFAANPLGTQSDQQGDDPAWNGSWQVMADKGGDGWAAVFAIPFETLGGAPERGSSWRINVWRMRANVTREKSVWADDPQGAQDFPMGVLNFE